MNKAVSRSHIAVGERKVMEANMNSTGTGAEALGAARGATLRSHHPSRATGRLTFEEILAREAGPNAARMMKRARMANRLAKALQGRPRAKAYSIKNNTLLALFRTFPDTVRVMKDPAEPNFVVLALRSSGLGLHAPATHFTDGRNEKCAA
jgi:hypothetical protein